MVDGVKLRTRVMSGQYDTNPNHFYLFVADYTLSFLVFVLENVPKPKSQYIMLEDDEHVSPEEKTNIFGRLTFSWMTPLMRLGYKNPLVMDDLWYGSSEICKQVTHKSLIGTSNQMINLLL